MPARPVLAGLLALAVAVGIGRFSYTPILPAMQRGAELSTAGAGLVASANYLGYLVGALAAAPVPRGPLRMRLLGACLAVVVLSTALMAGTSGILAWSVLRLVSGLASAGVFVLASGAVLDSVGHRPVTAAAGWLYAGVGVGITLSGVVVHLLGDRIEWRGQWLLMGLLGAGLGLLAWRWLPRAAPSGPSQRSAPMDRRRERRALGLLLGAYLLEGAGYVVTGTFLVALVETLPGMRGSGASVWIVVGLAAAPSCLIWSWLAARTGYAPALVLAYLAQVVGIGLPVLSSAAGPLLVSAVLFGGTFVGITALTLACARDLAPSGGAASIGLLTAAFGLGQIIGPLGAGLLAEQSRSFDPALLVASAVVLLGGLLMAALPWPKARAAGRSAR